MQVTVNSTTALTTALASAHGGDTILLSAGVYDRIGLQGVNIVGGVTIASADPTQPVVIAGVELNNCSGLTFRDVEIHVNERTQNVLNVVSSNDIHFDRVEMDDAFGSTRGGVLFRESSNVSISNSELHDIGTAIVNYRSANVTLTGNNLHDLKGDGIQTADSSVITISGNNFTNFFPSDGDHPDAIQFFTAGTTVAAHDISITNNTYVRGAGAPVQGIFMGDEVNLPYQNVVISGNAIVGGMYNGIATYAVNVTISNNIVQAWADMASSIVLQTSTGASLTNNQATSYIFLGTSPGLVSSGNITLATAPVGDTSILGQTSTVLPSSPPPPPPPVAVSPPPPPPPPPPAAAAPAQGVTITGTASADNISPTLALSGQPLPTTYGDTITGLGGNDTLNGGAGADSMVGGAGDDTYVVETGGDIVSELAGQGSDTVQSSISYALTANVEKLVLTGSANLTGAGNDLGNVLTGNGGANALSGLAGSDTLNGGAGADSMAGGSGDDTYVVDSAGDVVTEIAGEGTDTVQTSLSYTLGLDVENLIQTGSANINGVGNAANNMLTGNGGANVLSGLAGNDAIDGGGGADTLSGGVGADTLTGGNGDDRLDGGAGVDRYVGGVGKDNFVLAHNELADDSIVDFSKGDHVILTGFSGGSTVAKVAGSSTDWIVTDKATGSTEMFHLLNGYALKVGDFLFG